MTTAKNDVFIGFQLENCYLGAGDWLLVGGESNGGDFPRLGGLPSTTPPPPPMGKKKKIKLLFMPNITLFSLNKLKSSFSVVPNITNLTLLEEESKINPRYNILNYIFISQVSKISPAFNIKGFFTRHF